MSTRGFWTRATKDKSGTPSTTPSTSIADGSDGQNHVLLDASTQSVRHSDEKTGTGVLTAAALESVFLWKQPSKRRILSLGSAAQKRYFVITPNELAYKEKDNEDAEFKAVWKLKSEVMSVDKPVEGAKEFAVMISEGGVARSLRLSAADSAAAQKFASTLEGAIKAAAAPKTVISPIAEHGDEMSLEDSKTMETLKDEAPSAISTIDEVSIQTNVTVEASVDEPRVVENIAVEDVPVPISAQAKDDSKPPVWGLFSMCCAAE